MHTLDWGDMMTYSLYPGHEPDYSVIRALRPITSGLALLTGLPVTRAGLTKPKPKEVFMERIEDIS